MSIRRFIKNNSLQRITGNANVSVSLSSGGNVSQFQPGNGYTYHTFTGPGSFTISTQVKYNPNSSSREIKTTNDVSIDCLLVAGGGGGGARSGSGAGAGGIAQGVNVPLPLSINGTSIPITVGPGGYPGPNSYPGGNGGDSYFGSGPEPYYFIAKGGGAGACDNPVNGYTGGSGGGSHYGPPDANSYGSGNQTSQNPGKSWVTNYGNRGSLGAGNPNWQSGAGGGAGSRGINGNQSVRGTSGAGQRFENYAASLIMPSSNPFYPGLNPLSGGYGGGGAGGDYPPFTTPFTGGPGGGGPGYPTAGAGPGNPGVSGSGGGGGGANGGPGGPNGGAGGQGIVILKYHTTTIPPSLYGTSPLYAASSASHILSVNPNAKDGLYWIKPVSGSGTAFLTYCIMRRYGGGWMKALQYYNNTTLTGTSEINSAGLWLSSEVNLNGSGKIHNSDFNALNGTSFLMRVTGGSDNLFNSGAGTGMLRYTSSLTDWGTDLDPTEPYTLFLDNTSDGTFDYSVQYTNDGQTRCNHTTNVWISDHNYNAEAISAPPYPSYAQCWTIGPSYVTTNLHWMSGQAGLSGGGITWGSNTSSSFAIFIRPETQIFLETIDNQLMSF